MGASFTILLSHTEVSAVVNFTTSRSHSPSLQHHARGAQQSGFVSPRFAGFCMNASWKRRFRYIEDRIYFEDHMILCQSTIGTRPCLRFGTCFGISQAPQQRATVQVPLRLGATPHGGMPRQRSLSDAASWRCGGVRRGWRAAGGGGRSGPAWRASSASCAPSA